MNVIFHSMKMALGKLSKNFLLRIDRMVKEMGHVDRPVDPKDIV